MIIKIKDILDEDFVNYKKPSMFIIFPNCSLKCEKECGERVCQNSPLFNLPNIDISIENIVNKYLENNITEAVVFGGLEPMDSLDDLYALVKAFRERINDDIVIYTGYNKNEIESQIDTLKHYPNIVIKFGRFIPHQKTHFDEVLGVNLASDNQYAERIS